MLDHFWLVILEDTSTMESLILDATLLEMLPGMWWARLPASYTSEEKTDVLGISLFRKSFLV